MNTRQQFFADCWRSYKSEVATALRRRGMTNVAAKSAAAQLNEVACGDLTVAQCADRIIKGATK